MFYVNTDFSNRKLLSLTITHYHCTLRAVTKIQKHHNHYWQSCEPTELALCVGRPMMDPIWMRVCNSLKTKTVLSCDLGVKLPEIYSKKRNSEKHMKSST